MAIDLDTILETINTNADWAEDRSIAKAKLFASAVRRYLLFAAQQSSQPGGFSTTINTDELSKQLELATQFINQNVDSTGSTMTGTTSATILGVVHGHR